VKSAKNLAYLARISKDGRRREFQEKEEEAEEGPIPIWRKKYIHG